MSPRMEKIERILDQLPEELQREVVLFAEALLELKDKDVNSRRALIPSFGVWDSGDPNSADNDRIDADLVEQYAGPHRAD